VSESDGNVGLDTDKRDKNKGDEFFVRMSINENHETAMASTEGPRPYLGSYLVSYQVPGMLVPGYGVGRAYAHLYNQQQQHFSTVLVGQWR